MKLSELLPQCTPLPWPDDPCHDDAPDFLHQPNWEYARHAAAVLPELVVAAQEFSYELLLTGGVKQKTIDRLQAALAAAEEVKT